jgi:ABC-2 type transport system permease protein
MIRRLFDYLNIDYAQWRALSRASLKLDFRVGGMRGVLGHQHRERPSNQLISVVVFYLFTGIFLGGFALMNKNVFLTSTILSAYVMFMVGSIVLVEYNSVVVSPDDYEILGYRPISSRTFFMARLANVFFYVSVMIAAMALLPIVAYFFTLGFRPLLGLVALAAFFTAGFSVALFMIVLYAAMLAYVHPNRLRRVLSYLQLVTSFIIFGSYALMPKLLATNSAISKLTPDEKPWLLAFPPVWYASYLRLATGEIRVTTWAPALFSLVVVALLLVYAVGNLSLDYSRRLGGLRARSEEARPSKESLGTRSIGLLFRSDEPRAVALLIRSQFRYDQKFRLSVLGILPLTVFYLLMALSSGPIPDPFVAGVKGFGNSVLVYLAVMLFPLMLQKNLRNSDYYQASWIFFASPMKRDRLVLAAKNFVVMYFLVPYLLLIGVLFAYFYTALWHAVVQLLVLALIAHLVLQIAVFFSPEVPFSRPVKKGERSARMILIMMIMPVLTLGFLSGVFLLVYPSRLLTGGLLVFLALLTLTMERLLARRIQRRLGALQYQG